MSRSVSKLMVTALLLLVAPAQDAQSPYSPRPAVPYDQFFAMTNRSDRIRVFNEITAENKATLVRTHMERWLNRHRGRLSAEQVAMMEENIRFVTPELYGLPKSPELHAKILELAERTSGLFSASDAAQALTMQGDRVADNREPTDFLIIVEATTSGVNLVCQRGCAWKELSFGCGEQLPCKSPIDAFGMAPRDELAPTTP